MKNDFSVDTGRSAKKNFLEKIKLPFNLVLFLTGIQSIWAVVYLVYGVICFFNGTWQISELGNFAASALYYMIILCIFVGLIKILVDEKPFSNTLAACMRIIAFLLMAGSLVLPRFEGYETNFTFLFFLDGNLLTKGILFYVFGIMVKEGFGMQTELEETI